jgi:hypothetical protein
MHIIKSGRKVPELEARQRQFMFVMLQEVSGWDCVMQVWMHCGRVVRSWAEMRGAIERRMSL